MDYLAEIAKQGFGYLLFAGSLLIIFYQNKKTNQLYDLRFSDWDKVLTVSGGTIKDLLNSLKNLQDIEDENASNVEQVKTDMQQLREVVVQLKEVIKDISERRP